MRNPRDTLDAEALSIILVDSDLTLEHPPEDARWKPARGAYRWKMSYGDFYRSVGRPDLAAAQSRQDVASTVLTYGGILTTLGGLFLMVHGFEDFGHVSAESAIGVGLAVAGGTACVIGVHLDAPVITHREAQGLADAHNARLVDGLSPPAPPVEGPSGRARWVPRLGVAASVDHWGVSLTGRF